METTINKLFPLPNKQFTDALNGGFRKGGLYVITGSKYVGKIVLLHSFSNHLLAEHKVGFISTKALPTIEKWIAETAIQIVCMDSIKTDLDLYKTLKEMAEKLSVPIVAIATTSIKNNTVIETYCDVIIQMRRPKHYKEIFGETEFKITKNNYGALCSFRQRAVFNEIKFVEMER
jgi:archaellum biogenesis ATPase FlaH